MRRKLLLLVNSLEGGGAEKVMVTLADHLAGALPDGWSVRLATLDDIPDAYVPGPAVARTRLDARGGFLRSVVQVRRHVSSERPDVVLSFLTRANAAAILARGRGRGRYRCIISERINTTSHLGESAKGRGLRVLVRMLYPRADRVVAVSDGVRDELRDRYGVPADRLVTIPNPVLVEALRARGREAPGIDLPDDFVVSVGRLVPNKAGATLLRAFAAHRNRSRRLVMLGEGPDRARLEALAAELGLSQRVLLPGYVANPQAVVSRAAFYVSASRSEGFPNALVEAMALGRAVISTDCPSGPSEILAGEPQGRVRGHVPASAGILVEVDDVAALTAAMDLMDDPAMRRRYESAALARARSYDPADVFRAFESLVLD